jgi:lysophospholipase L1-like esterase
MTRESRARKVASAAMYGGGGLVGAGATVLGILLAEAKLARRVIGPPKSNPPQPDDVHVAAAADATAAPVMLGVLGDSSAAGFGVDDSADTPAARLAHGLSERIERPVHVVATARVGAQSSHLNAQIDALLEHGSPDVVVIMVGANDVTHRVRPAVSVRHLADAVRRLHEHDVSVVVGTCPDLGTIRPIPHPLRWVARRWSRNLAAAQTIAVVEEGGRSVSLGDLLGPEFARSPGEMFSDDRFHPSAAGYAAAAAALLPSVAACLGHVDPDADPTAGLEHAEVLPVAEAAIEAVDRPGTEVSGTEVGGRALGPRGLWAALGNRVRS